MHPPPTGAVFLILTGFPAMSSRVDSTACRTVVGGVTLHPFLVPDVVEEGRAGPLNHGEDTVEP
jgi:hypothetical protein